MIPEIVAAARAAAATGPVLIAHIGFDPPDPRIAGIELPGSSRVVDLDLVEPGEPLLDPPVRRVVVIARSGTDLRRSATLATAFPKSAHIVIAAAGATAHRPLALPVATGSWRALQDLRMRRHRSGGWSVEARFAGGMPPGELIAAITRGLGGGRLEAYATPVAGLSGAGAAHWRPADPAAVLMDPAGTRPPANRHPRADLALRAVTARPPQWADPRVRVVDRPHASVTAWRRLGTGGWHAAAELAAALTDAHAIPPVDERSVNPVGFDAEPRLGTGVLTQRGTGLVVELDGAELVRFAASGCVTDVDVAALRPLRAVRIGPGRHTGPVAAARVVAGLACAGVPLFADRLPDWAGCLGHDLVALLKATGEHVLGDDLVRQEHSIRLRRRALRLHGTAARWRELGRRAGVPPTGGRDTAPPAVSVVMCTQRPEMLPFALRQVGRQRGVELELALALHGIPADLESVREAVAGFDRPLTVLEVPREATLGAALNLAAAATSAPVISKMDDDDWYGPEHLADLLLALDYSGADLAGCVNEFVYLEQIDTTVQRRAPSERPATLVNGGTLTVRRGTFVEVGGFRAIPLTEDSSLLRAIIGAGGQVYQAHGLNYVLRRKADGHTWVSPINPFLRNNIRQWRGLRPSALMEVDNP